MDEIILFQSFLDAYGVTLNAKKYADNSTYTVTKQDVNRWWDRQTDAFKKSWNFLSLPAKLLLWSMGEEEFRDGFMNNLRAILNTNSLEQQISENEFLNDYANSLSSAQQNSVQYTKDDVVKVAYNIGKTVLDSTMTMISAMKADKKAQSIVTELQKYLSTAYGSRVKWNINYKYLTSLITSFLKSHSSYNINYACITSVRNTKEPYGYAPIILFWHIRPNANNVSLVNKKSVSPTDVGVIRPQSVNPNNSKNSLFAIFDVSSLIPDSDTESSGNSFGCLMDDNRVYLYNYINISRSYYEYGTTGYAVIYSDTTYPTFVIPPYTTPPHYYSRYTTNKVYNFNTNEVVEGNLVPYWDNSVVIDLSSDSQKSKINDYAIVKDVISTDQTLIGITSDSTDDADERTFLMNAESVEELANTKAVDYPDVLPKTIAGSIVGVGTDVKSAVDTIRDNNPEYPYIPETPISDTTGNSLFTLYNVTTSELSSLADYLWSTDFIDSFKKFFSEPSDSLISLVAYPVDVKSAGAKNIKIGYSDSGVSSHIITDYIQEFDLGSITIPPTYNNFLDNNPYTKVHIYLPFIGSCPLDADLVVGSTLRIKYRVELLTGNCMALITVSSINGTYPVYQFNGNLGMQFPLSSGSYASIYKNLITTGITTASAIASGGALTPLAVASVANTVINSKANVSRSGNVSGSVGYCGIMKPYVLVERPVTDIPTDYAKYNGVVTNRTLAIGSLHGYCVMDNVDVSTVPCTESEREEIIKLLMSGFYI